MANEKKTVDPEVAKLRKELAEWKAIVVNSAKNHNQAAVQYGTHLREARERLRVLEAEHEKVLRELRLLRKQDLLDLIEDECGRYGAQARYTAKGADLESKVAQNFFAGVADGLNMVWKHLHGSASLPGPELPYEHARKKKEEEK